MNVLFVPVCAKVDHPEKAADADLDNYAVIRTSVALLGQKATLRLTLSGTAPAGYRAGVLVSRDADLIDLNALSAVTLRTYLNGTLKETKVVDPQLVYAALLGGPTKPNHLEFVSSTEFNQVEIELKATALSALNEIRVFYAYAVKQNSACDPDNPFNGYLSRFSSPSNTNYSTQSVGAGLEVCVLTDVINPLNAVDSNLDNYASFASVLTVNCPTTLRVQLEGTAPATYRAGFVVGTSGLLDVEAINNLTLTTYLDNVKQESATGADLLNVRVLPDGKYFVSFKTTRNYNFVEIRRNSLVSALSNLRVYFGFGIEEAAFNPTFQLFSNFDTPVASTDYKTAEGGLVCVVCTGGFINSSRAADNSLTNYAQIGSLVSALTSKSIRLRLNGQGLAGNRAGVVAALNTGLISASLLDNITISTYASDGTTLLESASGSNLLSLGILNSTQFEVYFNSVRDFSWVEIELKQGVNALENTKVYYAFADDQPVDFPCTDTPITPLPVELISFKGKLIGDGALLTWQTASEINSSHFVVERSTAANSGFEPIGKVAAAGYSNTSLTYNFTDVSLNRNKQLIYYYRLREVDIDGKSKYSNKIALKFNSSTDKLWFEAFPNPVTGLLKVQLANTLGETQTLLLYNSEGRLVRKFELRDQLNELAVNDLPQGMYFMILGSQNSDKQVAKKLLIQN